jgi:ribosome-associated translation inhibitor RaiA
MNIPLQISYHGLEPSPALERRIREKAEKLGRFHDRIVSCRVAVEAHMRKDAGRVFQVRVELRAPGYEIVAGNSGREDAAHADPNVALRDAFAAATRQLEDRVRIARGDVKQHPA